MDKQRRSSFLPSLPSSSPSSPEERITALQFEVASLEAELGGRDPDKIIKNHIELLHRYNEIKDATQALIGRYALLKHTTVRAIHEELGLPTKD